MKIRYRDSFNKVWQVIDHTKLSHLVLNPTQTYEIRLPCSHVETFVDQGLKQCKRCCDTLEVTSYRD